LRSALACTSTNRAARDHYFAGGFIPTANENLLPEIPHIAAQILIKIAIISTRRPTNSRE
jgi:hypothetical protein